ncbi:MAG: EamA family transporter, partial [Clostridia bacterium]|nr:EamA family transporter [Clostridia bacterium]
MKVINSREIRINRAGFSSAIIFALLAAALFGICSPVSKILLTDIPPTFMAALLYLGAGLGMLLVQIVGAFHKSKQKEATITNKELPYVLAMIILDIGAPIFLMLGLTMS